MSNLKIGRYEHESITNEFSGFIEPEDRSWIIWLDADGKPSHYYPVRDKVTGAVQGNPVRL